MVSRKIHALMGPVLLVALGVAGCNSRTGEVTGRVLYKDKPIPSGSVAFVTANGKVFSSAIGKDQTYSLREVPVGVVSIAVGSHPDIPEGILNPPGLAARGRPPGQRAATLPAVSIPSRFYSAEKSGLRYTVRAGQQEHDIVLPH
jgi:hypothetical protein